MPGRPVIMTFFFLGFPQLICFCHELHTLVGMYQATLHRFSSGVIQINTFSSSSVGDVVDLSSSTTNCCFSLDNEALIQKLFQRLM